MFNFFTSRAVILYDEWIKEAGESYSVILWCPAESHSMAYFSDLNLSAFEPL